MQNYIDVSIDIFDQNSQKAKVKQDITIATLIEEIIKEFDDLNEDTAIGYALFLKGESKALDPQKTISESNIQMHDELIFQYAPLTPRDEVVVHENCNAFITIELSGKSIKIDWQPAVIGRPDSDPAHNKLLAVNLQDLPNGMQVSRKHAQIIEKSSSYFIEPLSAYNPTYLNDEEDPITEKRSLKNDDILYISKSRIKLIFNICPE